ncbi:hypothetical protein G9A89_008546 [Geosiphon pyriformis]|nr:hypothetical protein G9A89_008546 [Geosiphon pyriformis]
MAQPDVISFDIFIFVAIKPVDSFAGGSSSVLAGLEFWSVAKKKACIENVYSQGPSYKKLKKPDVTGVVVDSSAGSFPGHILQTDCGKCKMSWDNEVESKNTSISGMSNIENINNIVAEETSYIDSNTSETDDIVDNVTPKKTQMRIYILEQLPKTPFFKNLSNDDAEIVLPNSKFVGSNQLLLAKLCVLEKHSFGPVRLFTLDMELAVVINKMKELAICEKIVVNNDLKKVNSHSDKKIIVKKIPVDFSKSAIKSVFSKFGKIVSIKIQLIGLWQKALVEFESSEIADLVAARWSVFMEKNSVHVAKAIDNKQLWVFRDLHRALFYTLPVGTTAHDLSDLLELYGRKTCFIGCNPSLYVHDRCAIVCFVDKASKLFGHFSIECLLGGNSGVHDSDITLDNTMVSLLFSLLVVAEPVANFSSSSSKVLTTKVGGLESKMMTLEFGNLLHAMLKFDEVQIFTSGLSVGFLGAGVVIIINSFLAQHVSKIDEIPGQLVSVHFLFKDKLLVTILGLYTGASVNTHFSQAFFINSLISKAANSSSFMIIGGNFNENGSKKSASFKFCSDLGLVNIFKEYSLAKAPTWSNSKGIEKVLDFIFVSKNLTSTIILYKIDNMSEFFDTDYKTISVMIGLDELLDVHLNSARKQANLDQNNGDLNTMWVAANVVFFKHWYSAFDCLKNKQSSRFFKLKLLIVKIIKAWVFGDFLNFDYLIGVWLKINEVEVSKTANIVLINVSLMKVVKHLSIIKKKYQKSKYLESKTSENAVIKKAIDWCINNFCSDKGLMIKSILNCPFCKVVLDYLVIDNKLVVESDKVKLKSHQYMPLDHVPDDIFSGVIKKINMDELLLCINNLPNDKTVRLLGIPNKLWRHCGAWVLMIPKPYEWNDKILFKILSDQISLAYSRFNVLCGDNFSVLKVVEDALEKNRKLWLVLQNMHKAYNSTSLHCIKMCSQFIGFFGGIHENCINRVMTDFGFSDDYIVHNSLDQSEVFSSLLWQIFYDPFLCKVKKHEHLYGYRIDTKFVAEMSHVETIGERTSFLAVGVFVDDTIWVGSCQASTQAILDIANGFFVVNNISINNDKTVAISINQGVITASLSINSESHRYLGIFLSTESLFKPSLAQAYADKDNWMQFNYVLPGVCHKWDVMIRKGLKSKTELSRDFSNEALHYPSLYDLNSFEQMQFENKLWKKLDPRGPVPYWFILVANFISEHASVKVVFVSDHILLVLNILNSEAFVCVHGGLLKIWSNCIKVYTDGSLKSAGLVEVANGTAAYFSATDMSIGIRVQRLLSSTLAELQAIVLALECVFSSCSVVLYSDSQSAIDACVSESLGMAPDFHNRCWIKQLHIVDLIKKKYILVRWVKVKGHLGVLGNVKADKLAEKATFSPFSLLVGIQKHFLVAENTASRYEEGWLGQKWWYNFRLVSLFGV